MSKAALNLRKSDLIAEVPKACSDELAAVEFLEKQRWGSDPRCAHCGSDRVYKMTDAATGERSKRFLWRCRECSKQYTVRVGTVFEESRIALRHWCFAFWRASTSKKGVSAMELQRQCQITHKSALFMLHRIRWAMAPDHAEAPKLEGTVEVDETYVGGKPRKGGEPSKRGRGTKKVPVLVCLQRNGHARSRIITDITGATLKQAIKDVAHPSARIVTDELSSYKGIGKHFEGGHHTVNHGAGEYSRGDIFTNTAESYFSILKRGLVGIYHSVSKQHLHRYLAEFEFRWNGRLLSDGERVTLCIKQAEGKRLMYRSPSTSLD